VKEEANTGVVAVMKNHVWQLSLNIGVIAVLLEPVDDIAFKSGEFHVDVCLFERDNGNVHQAAANILQAEKVARPAAPCATYCYPTLFDLRRGTHRIVFEADQGRFRKSNITMHTVNKNPIVLKASAERATKPNLSRLTAKTEVAKAIGEQ